MEKETGILIVSLVVLAGLAFVETPPASAATFSTNVRVNDVVHSDQVDPALAFDGIGKIHAVWEDYRNGPSNPAIFYSSATDGGKLFASSVAVTAPLLGSEIQMSPSVAASNDGTTVLVTWTDLNAGKIYYARSTNGGQSFGPKAALSSSLGAAATFFESRVASGPAGGPCSFHVIWSVDDIARATGLGLWYSESLDCGQTFSTEYQVRFQAAEGSLGVAPDGAVAIAYVWVDASGPEIYVTVRISGTWQPPLIVNDVTGPSGSRHPSIGFDLPIIVGGPYTVQVAWEDSRNIVSNNNWDIYFRLFSTTMTNSPPSVRVNRDSTTQAQLEPWVSVDAGGNPKIAFTDFRNAGGVPTNSDIYYSVSTDHGVTFADQQVNDDVTTQPQSGAMVVERIDDLNFHAFWIVWEDLRTSVNAYDIYITGDGRPVLNWCGTPGYAADGVDPDSGNLFTTFTYCVQYRSPVGDAPAGGNPRLTILRNALPILVGAAMTPPPDSWVGVVGDYRAGRRYIYNTTLDNGCAAATFSYAFDATDVMGRAAPVFPVSPGPVYTPQFTSIDITGSVVNNDYWTAVGWDRCVSIFSALGGAGGPIRTQQMPFAVDYVLLSQTGSYLAVLGNDRPFTLTSGSHLRLYGPIADASLEWTQLYQYDFPRSALESGRPFDMTRDGSLVAVGTGVNIWPPPNADGTVYLFHTPATPGVVVPSQLPWGDRITSLRFSGAATFSQTANAAYRLVGSSVFEFAATDVRMLSLTNGNLAVVWPAAVGTRAYGVAIDHDATRVGVGLGWDNLVAFRRGDNGNSLWNSNADLGSTEYLSLSDDASYLATGSRRDGSIGQQAFSLWRTSNGTPQWPDPYYWRPSPDSTTASRLDMAVQTQAQYIVGCWSTNVYFWGAASPAGGPKPRTQDHNLTSECAAIAMTYASGPAPLYVRTGVIDFGGRLRVYVSTVDGDTLAWSYQVA